MKFFGEPRLWLDPCTKTFDSLTSAARDLEAAVGARSLELVAIVAVVVVVTSLSMILASSDSYFLILLLNLSDWLDRDDYCLWMDSTLCGESFKAC